jgi:uncharacterized Rmd1/YagE family protein
MRTMPDSLLTSHKTQFTAHALFVGEAIDLRALGSTQRAGGTSLVVELRGGGLAILFRYGVMVLFDATPLEQDEFLRQVLPRVRQPFSDTERETETLRIRIEPPGKESLDGDTVVLNDLSSEKLQLVADVLAKSVALARYEMSVSQQFDRIEPFAANLASWGQGNRSAQELLQHLGGAMLSEHKIVGGAQVDDTPELLWDHPELERLWARMRDELEIRERYVALNNKLALISRTAETALNLLQARRSLRVEWYVVGLIVLEIIITLVQWLAFGSH